MTNVSIVSFQERGTIGSNPFDRGQVRHRMPAEAPGIELLKIEQPQANHRRYLAQPTHRRKMHEDTLAGHY
jgi:hypothetical protein